MADKTNTVSTVIEELTEVQQKQAVWLNVLSYLETNFLDADEREAPNKIRVENCAQPAVTQEIVSAMVTEISDKVIGPLQVREAELLSSPVGGEQTTKKPPKKKGKGKK